MKVVLLAGGFGSRLSEETIIKPKPMVEIGGRPIILHIMELYVRDCVANVDLQALLRFHHAQGRHATVTAVQPPARFSSLKPDGAKVTDFARRPTSGTPGSMAGSSCSSPAFSTI